MPKPDFPNHRSKIHEIIRVNHAGEYGAKRIYEGQLKYTNNPKDKALINAMLAQEEKHLVYFSQQLINKRVRPTLLQPLWKLGGYMLGACSATLGLKTAMLITEAVEEVIVNHYQDQLNYLQVTKDEEDLYANIQQFQQDELEHQHIAIEHGRENAIFATILTIMVKKICEFAICISKKI